MAISDKLNYLIETKSQLKDMINYGLPTENQITNETTFRNYVKGIFEAFIESLRDSTTLYTNLPKISGNGTQITLNDTANAPMRITLKASELSQDATPTPDNPQDIHTISGDNSVVVEGNNLCNYDINTNLTHDYLDSSGNWVAGNDYYVNQKIYINSNKISIYVGQRHGAYANIRLGQFKSDGTFITRALITTTTNNITLDNNCSYIWVSIDKSTQYYFDNIAIVYGTTAYYEPYVSQTAPINLDTIEYCKIGNYEDEFILTSGKNIFSTDYKTSDTLTTYTKIDNNSFSYTCSGTWKGVTFVVPCEENTDYFINYKEYNPNNRGTYCEVKGGQTNTSLMARYHDYLITFNSGENTSLKITITNGTASDNTSGTISNIQLEKGTSASSYEPYGTNQWYLKKNIGKVVLDGSESWSKRTDIANLNDTSCFRVTSTAIQQNVKGGEEQVCDRFVCLNNNSDTEHIKYTSANVGYKFQIWINKTRLDTDDTTGFKTWLGSNNVTTYYILETPTYTQITGTLETQLNNIYEKLLSYKGTTNISQVNNDLPFVLGVSAIQDLE